MVRIRGRLVLANCTAPQLVFSHDFGHGLLRHTFALLPQDLRDFRTAVETTGFHEYLMNPLRDSLATLGSLALRAPTPRIIPAPRYPQYFAHLLNRKFGAVSVDELVLYFRSFVKMRTTFFKIAFSSRSSRISRSRSRRGFASGLRFPLPTNGVEGSSLYFTTQPCNVFCEIPSS